MEMRSFLPQRRTADKHMRTWASVVATRFALGMPLLGRSSLRLEFDFNGYGVAVEN